MPKEPPINDFEAWEAFKKEHEKQGDNSDDDAWEAYKKSVQEHRPAEDLWQDEWLPPKLTKISAQLCQTKISDKLDLHHMTQDQAYAALKIFIQTAVSKHLAKVLIVTGKGAQDQDSPWVFKGVLRRMVPRWLQAQPFKEYVERIEQAPNSKGGAGALVVYLKKR